MRWRSPITTPSTWASGRPVNARRSGGERVPYASIGVDATDARRPGMKTCGTRRVALVAMDAGPGPATMYAADATDRRPASPGVNGLEVSRRFEVDPTVFASLAGVRDTFQSSPMERATMPSRTICLNFNRLTRSISTERFFAAPRRTGAGSRWTRRACKVTSRRSVKPLRRAPSSSPTYTTIIGSRTGGRFPHGFSRLRVLVLTLARECSSAMALRSCSPSKSIAARRSSLGLAIFSSISMRAKWCGARRMFGRAWSRHAASTEVPSSNRSTFIPL